MSAALTRREVYESYGFNVSNHKSFNSTLNDSQVFDLAVSINRTMRYQSNEQEIDNTIDVTKFVKENKKK